MSGLIIFIASMGWFMGALITVAVVERRRTKRTRR